MLNINYSISYHLLVSYIILNFAIVKTLLQLIIFIMITFNDPLSNQFSRVVVYTAKHNFVESFSILPSWSTEFVCSFIITLSKGFPKDFILVVE